MFAAQLKNDTNLANGFNLVCHSQVILSYVYTHLKGGLICRAFLERYNDPPVHNFISWAGNRSFIESHSKDQTMVYMEFLNSIYYVLMNIVLG